MAIFYKLHCDGPGCRESVDSQLGEGVPMPMGWSEFKGILTISNGPHAAPTIRQIAKHYCWDCRDRMREHGWAPTETIVMAPEQLPSAEKCVHCNGAMVPILRAGNTAWVCSVCNTPRGRPPRRQVQQR